MAGRKKGERGRRAFHGDRPWVGELPVREDVRKELASHVAMRAEELEAEGWDPAAAREEARRMFGDEKAVAEECEEITRARDRRVRRAQVTEGVVHDLRYAARGLLRNPGFALVAVVTLALGVGANTAIFSVVDGVLLTPLPYDDPGELVWIQEVSGRGSRMTAAWPNVLDWAERASAFDGIAAANVGNAPVVGGDEPVVAGVARVSRDFWTVFPVSPSAGRLTVDADHGVDAPPVAVVSRSFARDRLGGEGALGAVLELSGVRVEVVGVLPDDFGYPAGSDLWVPAELRNTDRSRTAHNWNVVGRLADGTTLETARAELDRITADAVRDEAEDDPEYLAAGTWLVALQESVVGEVRGALVLLMGAAAFVLLVACTNLASTLLARGAVRSREVAVRTSLGAARSRIVRQLLTESAVLAVLGSAAGVALAWLVLRLLRAAGPAALPRLGEVGIDARVLAFAGAVAVATTFLFGLLPALRMSDEHPSRALRSGGRGDGGGRRGVLWNGLVATEVALAVVLLAGSGLLLRSFGLLVAEDAGFDGSDVMTAAVSLSRVKYAEPMDHARWYEELLAEVEDRPGVETAALGTSLPVGGGLPNGRLELDGDMSRTTNAAYVSVSGGYFEALDIPLLRGRTFQRTDGPDDPHVAIVSRSFAEENWPGEDPIGKSVSGGGMDEFWSGDPRPFGTVVGVVGDVRFRELGRTGGPVVYFPFSQRALRVSYGTNLILEAAGDDPGVLAPLLRREVRAADPDVPVRLRSMDEQVGRSLAERRFTMTVLGGFAAVALGLAVVGIYGVVSWTVSRRSREMGIRMALGAEPGGVRRLVVGGSFRTVALGLVAGVAGGLLLTRFLGSMLYQVSPSDPLTFFVVAGVLLAAGLAASWGPARRATRIDPIVTMRSE